MERIGVRDLRNATAFAVRRAGRGERIVITVAGRPVAQLGPLEPLDDSLTLDDLAFRNLIELPGTDDRSPPAGAVEVWAGFRLDRVLRDIRGR